MEQDLNFWAFSFQLVLPRLWEGMKLTLELTFLSGLGGFIVGMLLTMARLSPFVIFHWITKIYVAIFRGTPLLLQILFIYFALPSITGVTLDAFPSGLIALSLNAGAYFAEIFRAAIESIPKGQTEAARALGLNFWQSLRKVIVPQTYRRLIPPVMNELATLSKDTSLVSVVALSELLYITQRLGAKYLRPWEVYFWAALGYLLIVVVFSSLASRLEKNLLKKGGV